MAEYRECIECKIKFPVKLEFLNRTVIKSDVWYCKKCFKKFLSKKGIIEEEPEHIIKVREE